MQVVAGVAVDDVADAANPGGGVGVDDVAVDDVAGTAVDDVARDDVADGAAGPVLRVQLSWLLSSLPLLPFFMLLLCVCVAHVDIGFLAFLHLRHAIFSFKKRDVISKEHAIALWKKHTGA